MTPDQILQLLRIVAEYDSHDTIFWKTDLTFFANCNDLFCWGCADSEEIETDNDIELLKQSFADCSMAGAEYYGGELYSARRRHMRPQGACYKNWTPEVRELFNAAGPKREINIGNPYTQDYKYEYQGAIGEEG